MNEPNLASGQHGRMTRKTHESFLQRRSVCLPVSGQLKVWIGSSCLVCSAPAYPGRSCGHSGRLLSSHILAFWCPAGALWPTYV